MSVRLEEATQKQLLLLLLLLRVSLNAISSLTSKIKWADNCFAFFITTTATIKTNNSTGVYASEPWTSNLVSLSIVYSVCQSLYSPPA